MAQELEITLLNYATRSSVKGNYHEQQATIFLVTASGADPVFRSCASVLQHQSA
jgi:hypothetical protein